MDRTRGGDTDDSTVARLSIRIDLDGGCRIGPGKVRLLELIEATGSISAAGRAMAMSYRRAWLLVETLNTSFREPAVATQSGGRRGGGARLTGFGRDLVARYRAIEREAALAADHHLAAIEAAQDPGRGGSQSSPP